jgi:hypothetical protein
MQIDTIMPSTLLDYDMHHREAFNPFIAHFKISIC